MKFIPRQRHNDLNIFQRTYNILTLNFLGNMSFVDNVALDKPEACTSTQTDQRATLSPVGLSGNYCYIDLSVDSVALRSDCMDMQADLELCRLHNNVI